MSDLPPVLRRSIHASAFAHMGDVYLYHDLYGYLMKMSPDVLGFLAAFVEPAAVDEVCARFAGAFSGQTPHEFVEIFAQYGCLVDPGDDEINGIWDMVPVKSRWNVWQRQGDSLVLHTAWGDHPHGRHILGPAETALWDAIDGEKRVVDLCRDHRRDLVQRLIPRLVHHDVQALKLSHMPMSLFKGRRDLRPPYLTSTMPYAAYDPAAPPAPRAKHLSPTEYYRHAVSDADAQFDHQETTLSHLLRRPHPVLGGRTYGQALIDALVARGEVPGQGPIRVLEIGAGVGYVAQAACTRLGELGREVVYDILELSPTLAAAQRARCRGLPVTVREGDALTAPLGDGYHLILANEMIGDLPAVELTRAEVGLGQDQQITDGDRAAALAALGDAGKVISDFDLGLEDAPDPFYLTVGAFQLLGRVHAALAPDGVCVMTEFGELSAYPRLSTQLDHPELSIHFGHLRRAADKLGFATQYEYVIDLLDFQRTLRGMATTRSYFRALGHLLGESGVTLEKIGYTEDLFDELIAGKIDKASIGDLYFDRIEDRLMGLVPHEFKALILRKPAS